MSASLRNRAEQAQFNLIRYSTTLTDDTRIRLVVPLRAATATIAEMLAARVAHTLVVN